MEFLWEGFLQITWQQAVMYGIGILLIYLAVKKGYEPALLLPMGFGAILVNLPLSGVLNQNVEGIGEVNGIIEWLFDVGIEASEALPILLFIGIGERRFVHALDVPVRGRRPVWHLLCLKHGGAPGL